MTYKVAVPTADCEGMDVALGGVTVASYKAKDGFVEVENKKHAETLAKMAGSGMMQLGTFRNASPEYAPSANCTDCGREHFAFGLINGVCRNCRDKEESK